MTRMWRAGIVSGWRCSAGGFTLVELVTVMAIAAILAAFAVSRINVTSFNTEGFANKVAAMVRYGQKVAINQHRTVVVVVSGNIVRLCYTDAGCGNPVREPPGTAAFSLSAPSGVAIGNAAVSFSALGSPGNATTTLTITGDIVRTVTVEAQTGYVY